MQRPGIARALSEGGQAAAEGKGKLLAREAQTQDVGQPKEGNAPEDDIGVIGELFMNAKLSDASRNIKQGNASDGGKDAAHSAVLCSGKKRRHKSSDGDQHRKSHKRVGPTNLSSKAL